MQIIACEKMSLVTIRDRYCLKYLNVLLVLLFTSKT